MDSVLAWHPENEKRQREKDKESEDEKMLKREYMLRSSASNISFRESGTVNDFSLSLSLSLSLTYSNAPHTSQRIHFLSCFSPRPFRA